MPTTEPKTETTQAPEENWARCQRLARELDKDHLIQKLLLQIGKMRKRNEKHVPLWSFVSDATCHGAGVSTAICRAYGVEPDSGELLAKATGEKE